MKVEIKTSPESAGSRCRMDVWMMSLSDVAKLMKDEDLTTVAVHSPPWSMIPVVFDYDLTLGSFYGSMTDIRVSSSMTNDVAEGVAPVAEPAPSGESQTVNVVEGVPTRR